MNKAQRKNYTKRETGRDRERERKRGGERVSFISKGQLPINHKIYFFKA